MKHFNLKVLILLFSLSFLSIVSPAFSQSIEFNAKQNFIIGGLGFFPFSGVSNNTLKESLPTSPNITLEFSNFLGSICNVAGAADLNAFGPPVRITGSGKVTIDFTGASSNASTFGLFFTPSGGTCIFDILVTPPPKIVTPENPTSSSGGEAPTISNSELIQNALDFETNAKNKDLLLNTSSFSTQLAIDNIEKSLTSLNKLSQNTASSISSPALTKQIKRNINCAIAKDNQAKEALLQANSSDPSSKDIAKVKRFLQSAIKCKKDIQKTLKRRKNEN